MYRYYVIDWYEGIDVICKTNDEEQAIYAEDERYDDTDGECNVMIYDTAILKHKKILERNNII